MLLLGLLIAAPGAAQEAAESADAHDEEGARLYERKLWEAARKEWEAAYSLDPKPRYLFNIGQTYRKENLHTEAVDYFLRYLSEMERPENRDNPQNRVDPTIKIDLEAYIRQVRGELQRLGQARRPSAPVPEPAPYLVAEEIVEAEELFDQIVKEWRAGNTAVAMDLIKRLEEVHRLRGDPLLLLYFGQVYEKIGKKREALDAYRRFLASDPQDPQQRRLATARAAALTPRPAGQTFLWPSLVFGTLGLGGVATGVGLFIVAQNDFNQFQSPIPEQEKRDLRERGQGLGLGSVISYAVGGGLLFTSVVFLGVALKKGVRQRPAERLRADLLAPVELPRLRLGAAPALGGGALLLRGTF